jgi:hypothetical protein
MIRTRMTQQMDNYRNNQLGTSLEVLPIPICLVDKLGTVG